MIGVIDFGSGNTRSVLRALSKTGNAAVLIDNPGDLGRCARLVLPGVGAAGSAVAHLVGSGLWDPIRERVDAGTPLLGICLGAQLLLDKSEEGDVPGLGLIPGRCRAFPSEEQGGPRLVPHIGWNTIDFGGGRCADAYFVHSYWLDPTDRDVVRAATTVDGFSFPSVLRQGAVTATQFHPEKSAGFGRSFLCAFAAGLLDSRRPAWT